MGNTLTCCLRASSSPSPRASPNLGRESRQVKSKCESEVHKEAAEAMETVLATPKSEKLNSGTLKRHHIKKISAPMTPQEQDKRKKNDEFPRCLIKHYRSYPTVFLYDDTVRQPNLSTIIQAMTIAIYSNIKYRVGNRSFDIFDERRHPFRHELVTQARLMQDPELKVVYRYVRDLFSAEHLTAECAVVSLIYVERIMRYAVIDLCPTNWRRILLGAAIVAYELWDKQALWDVPYCQVINNIITFEDMNEIEMHFLNYIQFDTDVSASLFAKYYFDLRHVSRRNNSLVLF